MFKRSTKITSLLVAAASVVSMVPAMAADVTKVESLTGNVNDAVAFKDGVAVIAGEIDDKDDAFYYKDGKYDKLDDLDSGANLSVYGEKYVDADEGDYFVDLSSGKVSDDKLNEDNEDDAATALRKKLKDVDRYGEDDKTPDLKLIGGQKFGEQWYYTDSYTIDSSSVNSETNDNNTQIFTDSKGSYIDANYNLGKIKVKVTGVSVEGKKLTDTFNVENTKSVEKYRDDEATLLTYAKVEPHKVLTQDKDYIYRYATITISVKGNEKVKANTVAFEEVYGKDKDDNATAIEGIGTNEVKMEVIQKISKAQNSDTTDDAKYAKSVTNYVLSNDKGKTDDNPQDFKKMLKNEYNGYKETKYTAADGKLIAYAELDNDEDDDGLRVQALTLKQSSGLNYTDCKGNKTFAVEYSDDLKEHAFDIDIDGNIWFVDSGYIKKFDNEDDADKVYKVDGSINAISVYDKNNMVVWSTDDDVYSIVGKKEEEKEKPVDPTPAVTAGWNQAADGTYTYINADGTKKTGWFFDPAYNHYYYLDPSTGVMKANTWFFDPAYGKYYYLDGSGAMMANTWFFDPAYGHYYYFDGSGAMQTGWFYDGYNWYYADASGAMLANTTVDGYVLGASGAWIQ